MAQQRFIPTLTHQSHAIAEEVELESEDQQSLVGDPVDIGLCKRTQTVAVQDTPVIAHGVDQIRSANELNSAVRAHVSPMISKQATGGYNTMDSSKPLLLEDSADSLYSNGAIHLSTFVGSDEDLVEDKHISSSIDTSAANSEVQYSTNDFTTTTAPTASINTTFNGEGKSPTLLKRAEAKTASIHPSPTLGLTSYKSCQSDAVKSRLKFATRSISTDNPTIRRNRGTPATITPPLNRLGSISGPLLRANSFEKGTQTSPYKGDRGGSINTVLFDRLAGENNKSNPRYDSKSLSNLGVECMKASGALAISFKQLQKPTPLRNDTVNLRNDTVNDLPRHSYYESKANVDRKSSIIGAEVNTVVHMRDKVTANSQSSHVIKVDTVDEETPPIPQHQHIGYRLGQRKLLSERRRKIADLCCLSAFLGLTLMIIETECNIANPPIYLKTDPPSYVIKGLITFTTIILLALIGLYHAIEVKLFVVDNCIEDWRIAMSWQRVAQIAVELLLCSVHPLPVSYTFLWTIRDIKTLEWVIIEAPIDIIFSIPMFARLYLIIRVMLLHSKLFTDASSRSIGALNKITFNTRFVLKTLMTIFPGTVMGVFMLSLWIICAWTFRACESYHDPLFANFLNTLYMIAITFLSVGYGDFVPHTYCGRAISVISGLMGAGCTALVVAVIARKLELTRAEKHVHNFMLETQLNKKLKDAAANVLRETWLIYKYTKVVKRVNGRKVRAHQRKFLHAIQLLRRIKLKQRKLADQANSLTDFAKTTTQVHDIVADLRGAQENSTKRIGNIELSLQNLQVQIDALPQAVARIIAEKQASTSSFISATDNSLHGSPKDARKTSSMVECTTAMPSTQSSFDSSG